MSWKASKLTRHKQRLFAKYKDSEHPAYKSVAKEAKRELRRSRIKFEKQLANNIKDDAKSFYAYAYQQSKALQRNLITSSPQFSQLRIYLRHQ